MGKNNRRKKPSVNLEQGTAPLPGQPAAVSTSRGPDGGISVRAAGTSYGPAIEPGRKALVKNLKGRTELNGTEVTIDRILENGRVAVKVPRLSGTSLSHTETVAIKPENLEARWDLQWVHARDGDECPICMDTKMGTGVGSNQTASIYACCGGRICKPCFVETQRGSDPDRCPLCRADTSDTSDAATLRQICARAERGDANAQFNLAGYYDFGQMGVKQDQSEARRIYEMAAAQGHARASHNLAVSYRDGEGGPVNFEKAVKWFRVSAELGHVEAITNLGIAYMYRQGVDYDKMEAEKWLKKGAEAGDELAVQQLQLLRVGS